jgi:threonine/homoserine/homoserine lactone efflux protein
VDIGALGAGVLAGLAVALPLGAIGVLVVMTAARFGWRDGLAAGCGAATADVVYAGLAVTVGGAIAPALESASTTLQWTAAAVLLALGVVTMRRGWRTAATGAGRPSDPSGGSEGPDVQRSPRRSYLTVLGLTIVNPMTIVYFTALIAGGVALEAVASATDRWLFVVGVFLGSAGWQSVLALTGAVVGTALSTPKARRATTIVGGALIMAFAVRVALG